MSPQEAPWRQQRGHTLVEAMVALAVALALLVVALTCVLGASRGARQQDALARLDEDGALALGLLAAQLRMAGYSPPRRHTASGVPASHYVGIGVRGCDHGFVSWTVAEAEDLVCAAAAPGASAALAVAYEADVSSTWPGSAGQPTDCTGSQIATRSSALGEPFVLAENRFFIRSNPQTGNPTLYCAGSGGTGFASQPLIDNVETLSVRWGVGPEAHDVSGMATAAADDTVRYLTALDLDTELAADPRRWTRVRSARLCLVLATGPGVADQGASHLDCDGRAVVPADAAQRRVRRSFVLTVQLRNRGAGA